MWFFLAVDLYGHLLKYQEGNVFRCCSRSTLDSCVPRLTVVSSLQSLSQPIKHSKTGYGSWFSPKKHSSSSVGTNQDWIMFLPQTNCTRVHFKQVSAWMFWSTAELDYCFHTYWNKPHQGWKQSRVWFNPTKQGRCENTFSVLVFGSFFNCKTLKQMYYMLTALRCQMNQSIKKVRSYCWDGPLYPHRQWSEMKPFT